MRYFKSAMSCSTKGTFYVVKNKHISLPSSMHPIVKSINKSGKKMFKKGNVQVHEDRTHLLYKTIV